MTDKSIPILKDLVLVGGGHAHIQILRSIAMRPVEGLRVTLVSDQLYAPYSGMLPGYLGGWYKYDEIHFDLWKICQQLGVRFICGAVYRVDTLQKMLHIKSRPSINYDWLSVNVGSEPLSNNQLNRAIPLKPLSRFLQQWDEFKQSVAASKGSKLRVAMVGGGVAGVEVAFMIERVMSANSVKGEIHLFESDDRLLSGHSRSVVEMIQKKLHQKNIIVHLSKAVEYFDGNQLHMAKKGVEEPFEKVFWATQSAAPNWFKASGLPVDSQGFLSVDTQLRVKNHQDIFGAGDCVDFAAMNLSKSGVYAVRQGAVLAENISNAIQGKKLKKYQPQSHVLALMTLGEKSVVASWGGFGFETPMLWKIKDHIDQKFMHRFQMLDLTMDSEEKKSYQYSLIKDLELTTGEAAAKNMGFDAQAEDVNWINNTCGGCGSKVGSEVLEDVLFSAESEYLAPVKEVGASKAIQLDDAAIISWPNEFLQVQTVDYFRSFLDDPYLFGKITTIHALGDIYAMGAQPVSALATVVLNLMGKDKLKQELAHMLVGVKEVLQQHNTELIGGHTAAGVEMALGLSLTGRVKESSIWRKGGIVPGDQLILTKALGSGAALAAAMMGNLSGRALEEVTDNMLLSPQAAAQVMTQFNIHACTDVTGFGLYGHLVEMYEASSDLTTKIKLKEDLIPSLEAYHEALRSSPVVALAEQNKKYYGKYRQTIEVSNDIVFDPQTAGGLLLALPSDEAEKLVVKLQAAGYKQAEIIGDVQ